MPTALNPFAALLDPASVLDACAQSGALDALPVSAKRCADRTSPHVAGELAEHDAAVEAVFRQLIAKAAKAEAAPAAKPKKTRRTTGQPQEELARVSELVGGAARSAPVSALTRAGN